MTVPDDHDVPALGRPAPPGSATSASIHVAQSPPRIAGGELGPALSSCIITTSGGSSHGPSPKRICWFMIPADAEHLAGREVRRGGPADRVVTHFESSTPYTRPYPPPSAKGRATTARRASDRRATRTVHGACARVERRVCKRGPSRPGARRDRFFSPHCSVSASCKPAAARCDPRRARPRDIHQVATHDRDRSRGLRVNGLAPLDRRCTGWPRGNVYH